MIIHVDWQQEVINLWSKLIYIYCFDFKSSVFEDDLSLYYLDTWFVYFIIVITILVIVC